MLRRSAFAPRLSAAATRCFSSQSQYPFLKELGLDVDGGVVDGVFGAAGVAGGDVHEAFSPATEEVIGKVRFGNVADYEACVAAMDAAKPAWAAMPAPARGEVVRKIGEALREKCDALGALISLEMGKIKPEGVGEVQEAIDICDYAVGLSRSLNGSVIPSERPNHFMMERYNPLQGHVGVISAFNFPCAVYFWNLALSLVCGNTTVWKGAPTASLVTMACSKIVADVLKAEGLTGVAVTCQGGADVGQAMVDDKRIELMSFTGSTAVGRHVAQARSGRFAKNILELGGNNATIVLADADMEMVKRGVLFSAVGTCGQRCTTLRRLYVEEPAYDELVANLVKSWKTVPIGDPLADGTLCGPLHNTAAVAAYEKCIADAIAAGGEVLVGGKAIPGQGHYVEPTIIAIDKNAAVLQTEVFVPVMYVMKIDDLDDGIACNNNVPQGLSSSLFTTNQQAVFKWTGPQGSDCGIVNVNIGPSGAEIGGAFGGEKETGGGRESGSDAWKQYMRRSTCTVNHGSELPLAQGIKFD
jgi:aldehyde dehydrogenase family 7 protein A1